GPIVINGTAGVANDNVPPPDLVLTGVAVNIIDGAVVSNTNTTTTPGNGTIDGTRVTAEAGNLTISANVGKTPSEGAYTGITVIEATVTTTNGDILLN